MIWWLPVGVALGAALALAAGRSDFRLAVALVCGLAVVVFLNVLMISRLALP